MPKHIDNVPALAEFRPPWITEDGNEVEIDKDKLKKYIHGLVTDKAKAQDARDDEATKVKDLTGQVDTLQKQVDEKNGPDSTALVEAERSKTKAAEERAKAAELETTRLLAGLEAGLTPAQSKRLSGSTKEELEEDAKEFAKDLGVDPKKSKEGSEDPDEGEEGDEPFQFPQHLVGAGGGKPLSPTDDIEKAVDGILGRSYF